MMTEQRETNNVIDDHFSNRPHSIIARKQRIKERQ